MPRLIDAIAELVRDLLPAEAWRLDQDDADGWCVSTPHPNDLFRLSVHVSRADGDVTIGTVAWHTHLDLLGGKPSDLAPLRVFLNGIFRGETEFALEYASGALKDAWPCDSREEELEYAPDDVELRFVRWIAA